jgi:folate-binding protein YgfZ
VSTLDRVLAGAGAVAGDGGRPLHFGNPRAELACAGDSCVLADRSDLVRLLATGPDYLELLQRLSTGDVASLQPGQGRETVLTSPKGRIVERLFVHHLGPGGILTTAGARDASRALEHVARFTFAEKTGLSDATAATFQLVVVGPRAPSALERGGWPRPASLEAAATIIDGLRVHVLGQDGLSAAGFSVCGDAAGAPAVWSALARAVAECGGRPTGNEVLEADRILRGVPAPGHELTEDHNPLEAGLEDAVSFEKGCYVGQEVVARLRTYDKVSRSIVGLRLAPGAAPPAAPVKLFAGGHEAGTLTSAALPAGGSSAIALGYVKRKEIRPGLELRVGDPAGPAAVLVELPFDRS